MATYTENFDLIKPDDEEYYDVADFNANMDIIDEALAESAGGADKIGEPSDTGLNTVFGKMNGFISEDGQGVRIIKSIQRITDSLRGSESWATKTYPIKPVNLERSLIIMERLGGDTDFTPGITYTPAENSITISYYFSTVHTAYLGFWVIEFY